jgi:hypothetical protein
MLLWPIWTSVSSVSVMEWYKINKSFGSYPSDELRVNWNNRCFSVNRDIKNIWNFKWINSVISVTH